EYSYSCNYYLSNAFFFYVTRPPPNSTLFPYTTLFRSHEAARRHLGPVQAERNLVVAFAAGHPQRQVIEDPLVEPVHHRKPVGRGEIDPRLPLCRADVAAVSLIGF